MTPQEHRNERLAQTIIKTLKRRNMEGFYCATAEVITATKVKDGQWKIAVENSKGKKSYRYFDTEAIERSQNRRRMETIPWEERKKRNNVEATIFQYCVLTRNNKTRYRGLFKQTLQALARCAWINMRRLFLFDVKNANLALQKA